VNVNLKISDYSNRVLGVVKEKYGFKDKSQALNKILDLYGADFVEKEIKEDVLKGFLAEIDKVEKNKIKSVSFKELDKICELE
jgi:hypothetical protein